MAAKFVVHPDKSGSYRWKLVSTNGQTIATSGESFSSKAKCAQGRGECEEAGD